MRRFPLGGTLLLIPALILFGLAVGCEKQEEPINPGNRQPPLPLPMQKVKIAGAPGATLTGVVRFDGVPPVAIGKFEDQLWLVDKDGGVANAVISLVPGDKKEFAAGVVRKEKVVLDCAIPAFVPHVVAVQADIQELFMTGALSHSTKIASHPKFDAPNAQWLDPKKDPPPKRFKFEPTPINIASSVHSFMWAKLVIFDHPYFAVTDAKGAFSIADIPVDEELTVHIWHESMGEKGRNDQKVTLKKGEVRNLPLKTR